MVGLKTDYLIVLDLTGESGGALWTGETTGAVIYRMK